MSSSAGIIIIGDEILSGRTKDTNINWIANELNQIGIHLKEARVIEDDKKTIPSKITKYRSDIRTASETIENKIKAANDMTAFKKLFDSADADGITDINRWPEQV